MTEKQLADKLFLLLAKVLKLPFFAEYSIPTDSTETKHKRLDFVGLYEDKVEVVELKVEPITPEIVIDTLINKNYLNLAKKEFSTHTENIDNCMYFYFISSRGITEEALSLIALMGNVEYVPLTNYTETAIKYALQNSRGLTPINVLGSIVKDYRDIVDSVFIKELQNQYSVHDYYKS